MSQQSFCRQWLPIDANLRAKNFLTRFPEGINSNHLVGKSGTPPQSNKVEKAMAPHSSTVAWKIPWTEEPGGLQSTGSLSWTRLSDFTLTFHFHALEKEMAPHSSILTWRIPGTGEPGGLPSMGLPRVVATAEAA